MRPARRRFVVGVATVCVLAAAGTMVAVWWQEGPVREAEAALASGDAERSLRTVQSFLREHPQHQWALSVRARSLVRMGRPDEAIRLYERYGAADLAEMHAWAQAYMMQGRWTEAMSRLAYVVEREPANADALYEITTCRIRLGLLDQARESARALAAIPGQEARGYVFLGAIQNDLGNPREAAEAYSRALKFRPGGEALQLPPEDFFHAYGEVLLGTGEPERAAEMLRRSVEARPTAPAYSDLGRAWEQLGHLDRAESAWRSALSLDAADRGAREGLADIELARGAAAAALELLVPSSDTPTASTAYLLQRSYSLLGKKDESEAWKRRADELRTEERFRATAQRVISEAPDSPWASALRAYRLAEEGRWGEAEPILNGLKLDEPFVAALRESVRTRSPLPPLTDLPISRF